MGHGRPSWAESLGTRRTLEKANLDMGFQISYSFLFVTQIRGYRTDNIKMMLKKSKMISHHQCNHGSVYGSRWTVEKADLVLGFLNILSFFSVTLRKADFRKKCLIFTKLRWWPIIEISTKIKYRISKFLDHLFLWVFFSLFCDSFKSGYQKGRKKGSVYFHRFTMMRHHNNCHDNNSGLNWLGKKLVASEVWD